MLTKKDFVMLWWHRTIQFLYGDMYRTI